eukprot:XP_011665360.1 PREDICTED: fibropellin-1-like [Strongylocentrotus purpuratus]
MEAKAKIFLFFVLAFLDKGRDIVASGICSTPSSILHGSYVIQDDYYALYNCDPGYVMDDVSDTTVLICDALSLTWTGTLPQCNRVNCPEPPVPNDGSVFGSGRYYGDVITYACDTNYRLYDPSVSRTCSEDGTWSGESPECFPDLSSPDVCPSGSWQYGNNTCFRANSAWRTWKNARDVCASGSPVGQLATVVDEDVQTFLEDKLGEVAGVATTHWIGGSYGYIWYWDDSGLPLDYFSWAWEEPSSTSDNIQCVFLSSLPNPGGDKDHDYNWNDDDCLENEVSGIPNYVICEYDMACSSISNLILSAYRKYDYDEKCEVFVTDPRNWNDGRAFCSGTSGRVVEIYDGVKQDFLVKKARIVDSSSRSNWWIGAKRKTSAGKIWHWVDGSPITNFYWGPREPSNPDTEQCLDLLKTSNHKWNDGRCSSTADYLCQYTGPKEPQRCYDPGEPAHGTYAPSNSDWLYGSHVTYSCDEGYTLDGNITQIYCNLNGTYTPGVSKCIPVSCGGVYPSLDNSTPNCAGSDFRDIVFYVCDNGYYPVGEMSAVCQPNGSWSQARGQCQEFDECESSPCLFGSTCLDMINYYQCDCTDGYNGTNCEFEIDECFSNTCQNDATCYDVINGYTCSCTSGYDGIHCENEIDECSSNPCQNGATCSDFINMYNCTCLPGYEGMNCENEIDECSSNPCLNGATCTDFVDSYNCTCLQGFDGSHCQSEINECSSNPCMNGGTCFDAVDFYNCTCQTGYHGINCESEVTECSSNPCLNGATCNEFVDFFNCSCPRGYDGIHCQKDIDECLSNPCQNGATCSDAIDFYNCSCIPGFDGVNCENDINECLSNPCHNGATCSDETDFYNCICIPGFDGVNCENDIDECLSNPCQNGASCSDAIDSYNCSCIPGFDSVNCGNDINECLSDPCHNSATCSDEIDFYNCSCIPGFGGIHCENEIDECVSNPCYNGATCMEFVDFYNCSCQAGYDGPHCENDINECLSNPCQSGATCSDQINFYNCSCIPGFDGINCESDINECLSNPCHNGATCSDEIDFYNCTCKAGYHGVNCEIEINKCFSNPCQNGATCTDIADFYNCSCTLGYDGINCENEIDECLSSPCQNGGSCSDYINLYICTCLDGYEGSQCEQEIDECLSNPCLNGATCKDSINIYSCTCPKGYDGIHCEKKSSGEKANVALIASLSVLGFILLIAITIVTCWLTHRQSKVTPDELELDPTTKNETRSTVAWDDDGDGGRPASPMSVVMPNGDLTYIFDVEESMYEKWT